MQPNPVNNPQPSNQAPPVAQANPPAPEMPIAGVNTSGSQMLTQASRLSYLEAELSVGSDNQYIDGRILTRARTTMAPPVLTNPETGAPLQNTRENRVLSVSEYSIGNQLTFSPTPMLSGRLTSNSTLRVIDSVVTENQQTRRQPTLRQERQFVTSIETSGALARQLLNLSRPGAERSHQFSPARRNIECADCSNGNIDSGNVNAATELALETSIAYHGHATAVATAVGIMQATGTALGTALGSQILIPHQGGAIGGIIGQAVGMGITSLLADHTLQISEVIRVRAGAEAHFPIDGSVPGHQTQITGRIGVTREHRRPLLVESDTTTAQRAQQEQIRFHRPDEERGSEQEEERRAEVSSRSSLSFESENSSDTSSGLRKRK